MNFNDAQKAAYGRVIVVDPVHRLNNDEQEWLAARRKAERERRVSVKKLADHLFDVGFEPRDIVDAIDHCDQENAARLVDLIRSDDDAELGRMVKALVHAYSWRVAECKV